MTDLRERVLDVWRRPDAVVLVLIRHGRTEWNATRRFVGRTDVPLDGVGTEQAHQLATLLPGPLDAAYSSPLQRALDTARAIVDDLVVIDDLAELDQGALEGLDASDAFARFPEFFASWAEDPEHAHVPGGETLGALRDRSLRALDGIAARHSPGQVIGVFTHQMVIASTTCAVDGRSLRDWRRYRVGNTGLSAVAWTGAEPPVVRREIVVRDVRLVPGA